ncbi:MAG: carboxylating nicotinate-nucleotide diphosphorylase [Armatimonadetes bacterium]|nr:carboxylating nicotinate-nucleotide diphosphorylase [Armatimonadota bacterium]
MTASPWLKRVVAAALEEDLGRGDITSEACVAADVRAVGEIVAKAKGVLAGMEAAAEVACQVHEAICIEPLKSNGDPVEPGDVVARVAGPGRAVLAFERTALNFLQQLSGVATLTRAFVEQVAGTKAVVVDTRKTVPGMRMLQKAAVVAGGGHNHRFGLYDAILIKDNHIRLAGGVAQALERVRAGAPFAAKIEIEVSTPADAELAADLGADIIMLDNMGPEAVRESLARIKGRALTELSGGVRLDTIRERAELGVDLISVGALTHSAPALDLSLEITEWTR